MLEHSKKDCSSPGFKALMITQFLGALNDNVFKLAVSLITMKFLVTETGGTLYLTLGSALFVLPFILFSPYAGLLADRFSKSVIIIYTKWMELIVMAFGLFFLIEKNILALFIVLFFMGLQSAIFSPSKYGILPELLHHDHLSKGNGYLQLWTFLAIICGTALGGQLMAGAGEKYLTVGVAAVLIALLGLGASFFIARTESAKSERRFEPNPFKDVFLALREIKKSRGLFLTVVAIAYFWFIGAVFQLNALLYARQMLLVGDFKTSMLLTAIALGIGFGSIAAGRVSEGKVELGLVPLGAMGLSIFSILLGFSYHHYGLSLFLLFLVGLSGGFFIVPLNAFLQHESPHTSLGRYLAASSFINSSGMLLASCLLWVLKDLAHLNAAELFLIMGLSSIAATVYIFKTLPEAFVRCINWVLTHALYKVKVIDKHHVPEKGGALLVVNHASYIDPSVLLASIERPIRFLMFRNLYEAPLLHPVAKIMKAIPVSLSDPPKTILRSLETAREAIEGGELVAIFAEGGHTRIGQMLPFKKGFERIMKGLNAPIIPVHLDKIWGSIFSYKDGKYFWKFPEELPYPITVSYGAPLPAAAKAEEVRRAVQELSANAFQYRKEIHKLLHVGFLRQAKKNLFRPCMVDSSGVRLNYLKALAGALMLSEVFGKLSAPKNMVGVLLPSTAAAALTNIGLLIAGKVPVNLNFTAPGESVESAKKQCGIETVITSRKFLEKLGTQGTPDMVFLEDIKACLDLATKAGSFLSALFLPWKLIQTFYFKGHPTPESLATVIFSSGSTGEPKGVMLTHGNIASNIEAVYDIFQIHKNDTVMGILPFFHSFGFTGTLWLPLLAGAKVAFHPNPLDAAVIGNLVEKERGTVLMSTPTFLLGYIRKCTREQFKTLRFVIVGAEKLKSRIAEAFHEKFGILPLEGYGATELSPIATMNIPDYREKHIRQKGMKPGSIGHPIPGVAVKIVDPDRYEILPPNEDGLLLVKGPNVMQGYLGQPERTAEVIRDGWYVTGDIAQMDEDGFITITDRLSRFSKIAGEMVPHIKLEEAIHQVLNETDQICAVTSVPDEKKGERLVVLHTKEINVEEITRQLSEAGLPALWIPKKESFLKIDSLPLLGSGKLDLKMIKALAVKWAGVS